MSINRFIRCANILLHRLHFSLVTLAEIFVWKICGVKLGEGARFAGWCRMIKIEGADIEIGKNAHFVSSSFINHIGINHKCIIATETSKAKIKIGDNCGFSGVSIVAFKSIEIGNNVRVGINSTIMDSDFHPDDSRSGDNKPIKIDDNVWLGANVMVMKGVHIGENSMIGANSLVTKDIPANVIAAGSPCRVIRDL